MFMSIFIISVCVAHRSVAANDGTLHAALRIMNKVRGFQCVPLLQLIKSQL